MDSIRVTAKTVSDAITEASIQLETSSDNIEYTVIDEGSKGFFGIGRSFIHRRGGDCGAGRSPLSGQQNHRSRRPFSG